MSDTEQAMSDTDRYAQICAVCGIRYGNHSGAGLYCPLKEETGRGERFSRTQSFQLLQQQQGMTCADKYCRTYNPYATPNQPDGTYKCYSCRNR